jgi:hypothetical protein
MEDLNPERTNDNKAQSDEGSALFLLSLQFFGGECASVTGK